MRILVVDDDARLRNLVRIALERSGYEVITASDGRGALTHATREQPHLIVLDVGLPEMDGFEVCRKIRNTSEVPILFLTARDDEIDRVLGLELGADDYVTKPFSPRELVARIRAILKRSAPTAPLQQTLVHGVLALDQEARHCLVSGQAVALTGTEFALLEQFMQQPQTLVARPKLIGAIWGAHSDVSDRTLDSHLRNLRRKLGDAGCAEAIETVHGQGIRLGACL